MAAQGTSFRVGRVRAYRRGRIWHLGYYENGRRRRPRAGPDCDAVRQLAAQANAQLEVGAPAPLSFEPVSLEELRGRWLNCHEHVRRSSAATVWRYRTASALVVTSMSPERSSCGWLHGRRASSFS